ncbi:MAG: tetratricopeptide repeat protein [Chloroflexi bacterium]|nr:tetratricopeptide repeat protein [Chloroflexota bacterium]
MDRADDLIEFYTEGCVRHAAQSWWELFKHDARILREPDERANILFCAQECHAQQQWEWVARFWDLTEDLYNLGYWNEYAQLDRACLAAAQQLGNVEMQAAIYSELGWLAMQQGALAQAHALVQTAYDLYSQMGNLRGQLIARRYVATIAMAGQQWEFARVQLEELQNSLHAALARDDPTLRVFLTRQIDIVHDSLGIVLQQLRDYAGAERELQLGLAGAYARGHLAVAISHLNLGKLRIKQERYTEAQEFLGDCLAMCDQFEFRAIGADAQFHLAEVAHARSEIRSALELARAAWQTYQTLGAVSNANRVADFISKLSGR